MKWNHKFALSIAGHDTSSGAGISADLQTFRACGVYGLSVITALTLQTHDEVKNITWRNISDILFEIETLFQNYPIESVKIGIVKNVVWLQNIIECIRQQNKDCIIVVDTVWKSTSGTIFFEGNTIDILNLIDILTPNITEAEYFFGTKKPTEIQKKIGKTTAIYLKNYATKNDGSDVLITSNHRIEIPSSGFTFFEKHGSGCVLSSAIAGFSIVEPHREVACRKAKILVDRFLSSDESLAGKIE